MSLALSICVLFISLMQLVNGAKFSLLLLSGAAAVTVLVMLPFL